MAGTEAGLGARWASTSGPGSEGKSPTFVSPPQEILNYISRKEFEPLLRVDQLNLEREKHKVFLRFSECGPSGRSRRAGVLVVSLVFRALTPCPLPSLGEEEISFPPTYRYERGSRDTYAWHKQKPTGVSEENRWASGDPQGLTESSVCRVKGLGLCSYCSSFSGHSEALGVILGAVRSQGGRWALEPSVVGA